MRKTLFVLILCLFSGPAFAQARGTGQSSGGPARVGIPGQITPAQPGGSSVGVTPGSGQTVVRQSRSRKVMRRHRHGTRAAMRSRRSRM
jgi:hypothetical protein